MRTLILISFVFFGAVSFLRADIRQVKNSKGAYYEVIENKDGSHTFVYVLPGSARTLCESVSVSGGKDGATVFAFSHVRVRSEGAKWLLKDAIRAHPDLVQENSPLVFFTVNLKAVDKLAMRFGFMSPSGEIAGTTYEVDLLWLATEAKKDGRYKVRRAEQAVEGKL